MHIYPSVLQALAGARLCGVSGGVILGGIGVGVCKILDMNFYEKALFVKVDVATAV